MALSSDLISQFVKSTNDAPAKKSEATVTGKTVEYNGATYVRLDGSDRLTPVSTVTSVSEGDRVTVLIKDHEATITGNLTSPSAKFKDVEEATGKISEFEIILAYRVTAEDIEATTATIEQLKAQIAKFDNMQAVEAKINSLLAKFANLEYVTAKDAEIINADIENLKATFGDFDNISADDMTAINATIEKLKGYTAEFTYVSADILSAMRAHIKELDVNKLDATSADIKYANIDFANITEAAVEKIFADSGIIKDLIVNEGHITGELVGVTIKGDVIEGGTVKADKLVVKGSDGLFYKLNTDGVTTTAEQTEYNSLDGSVITAKSVTAEKVNVNDLVAFGATIGGFNITDDSLYSGVKSTVDNTARGIYLDNDGQFSFGDSNSYMMFYKDEDGSYKLAISAADITLKTGKSVEDEVADSVATARDNLAESIQNVTSDLDDINQSISDAANRTEEIYSITENNATMISELIMKNSGFEMNFQTLTETIDKLGDEFKTEVDVRNSYIRFIDGDIYLGKEPIAGQDDFQMVLSNQRVSFKQNGVEVAYLSNNKLYIVDAEITGSLSLGNYIFEVRSNGNLGIRYDG